MKIEKNNENKCTFIINNKTFFIPSAWNLKKLSDITTVKDGTHDSPKYVKNGIPFITSKNLKNNKIDFIDVKYISKEDHEKFYKRSDVSMGDLLFGMIGTIGNPTIVDTDINFSIKNVALIKKNNNYCQKFLKYQLLSSNIISNQLNSLKNGGVLSFIKLSDIRNLMIIDIDLEKQRKISYILSLQENHIENIKDLIKKIETRNQYYAEKILSGELRVRKNKNSNIEFYNNTEWQDGKFNNRKTKYPLEWTIEKIGSGNTRILTSGIKEFEGYKKYYATGEVNGANQYLKETEKVSYYNRTSRANMQPIRDSIWFARMQNTLKCLYFKSDNDIILSTGFAGIHINTDLVDLEYMFHLVLSRSFNVIKDSLCLGATQKSINNENIKHIEYLCPKKDEQILISTFLNSLNYELKEIKILEEKEQLRFQWLLDNLLSGEYQVVDD